MRIDTDPKLDFDDVFIRPKRSTLSSRKDVILNRQFKMYHTDRTWSGFPLIAANMDTVGTTLAAKELEKCGAAAALHKHITDKEICADLNLTNSFCTIGIESLPLDTKKFERFGFTADTVNINIDVANAYQESVVKFVSKVRAQFPNAIIMAGNVVTADMTEALILAGADIVKIGIGPGAQCETRKVTGVGFPQLSAIIECADAAHGLGALICADGGCKTSGDIAKAFAAGADFVMVGTMLAGHKETISKEEMTAMLNQVEMFPELPFDSDLPNNFLVQTYGMSSKQAMDKHNGGVAAYRASEGKTSQITYRGTIKNTIQEIMGGIRSTCTYLGAKSLKELPKRATFIIKK